MVRKLLERLELEWIELERQQLVVHVMAGCQLGLTNGGRSR